jgi:NAD+ diphosphatase
MTSLAYIFNPIVRHSAERDADALERHAQDANAVRVLIAGDIPILRAGEPGTALLRPSDLAGLPLADGEMFEQVLLGTLAGRPVVARLAATETADRFKADPAFVAADLRSIAVKGLVAEEELGILAMAKSLLDWHRRHRFCANCGSPTRLSAAGFRRDCPQCGTEHFPRTDPVVIMLVAHGDKCLLGRQARFAAGTYSCLAGFLEPGETIEDAVRRETFEEAGIRIGTVSYTASQPWPFPSSLMIGCTAEALSDVIAIDRQELEDARWFTKDELRLMLRGEHPEGLSAAAPIAIAHHLIRRWLGL